MTRFAVSVVKRKQLHFGLVLIQISKVILIADFTFSDERKAFKFGQEHWHKKNVISLVFNNYNSNYYVVCSESKLKKILETEYKECLAKEEV